MSREIFRKCVAEMIGTFAIVFFGAGSVCVNARAGVGLGLVGIALTFGLVVAVMVSSLGHISGAHFNPAVTAMALATRRMKAGEAAAYVVAQLGGAVLAAYILRNMVAVAGAPLQIGATGLASDITPMSGMVIEALLTFFLMLVIFGTAIDGRGHKLGGIAIGGVVTLDILVGGPLTGASMNPARTFGPALISGQWAHHWVYWVGPILGALLGAVVYEQVIAPKRR